MSYTITIDGVAYAIHAYNCAVFLFSKEFSSHNHVFIVPVGWENEGIYIFGRQDVIDRLRRSGNFPVHYLPYVPDNDIAAYQRWRQKTATETVGEVSKPLSEAEIEYLAKELEDADNFWDELEGGEQ